MAPVPERFVGVGGVRRGNPATVPARIVRVHLWTPAEGLSMTPPGQPSHTAVTPSGMTGVAAAGSVPPLSSAFPQPAKSTRTETKSENETSFFCANITTPLHAPLAQHHS